MNEILKAVYFVPVWKNHHRGYIFTMDTGGINRHGQYSTLGELYGFGRICIPLDPITAIGLGLVTPEEINMPEGLRAAYNLLK
jgi:hypothetical protein